MLDQMRFGYEAHYLKVLKGRQMLGLLCFNIDHTHQSEIRAYIRHLTVNDRELYPLIVKEAANFIFNQTHCDCIRVDIHHFKESDAEDAKMQADTFVKDCFGMARKGFKWKTMINTDGGVRY